MTKGIRYTEEFKKDAVSQVTDRGYTVKEVSDRLGISTKSLYDWIKQYRKPESLRATETEQVRENRRLKAELARVTEERDILKKATAYFVLRKRNQVKYAFNQAYRLLFSIRSMCRVLKVHHSGFYA